MSLSAFLQQYVKPSRWWRRQKTVQVTIWPRFLAQALCPHIQKQTIMWDTEKKSVTKMCTDCHKHIVEVNDCAHGEVSVFATENQAPLSYRCEHCGIELEFRHLPKGVRVVRGL